MNPFIINGIIPDEFFCDRKNETEKLLTLIRNNSNVLLTSQRRMGKTQLIRHVYRQKQISENYYAFYIDIYSTTSLREFILLFAKEIYGTLVPAGRKVLDAFIGTLKSMYGGFGYDAMTGLPSFDIKLGDIRTPELTLSEIFQFLEKADKPCVYTIDEFQQIGCYKEKNVEALLRTYVQKTNNCMFVFAGSDRHVLENMFNSPAKPFYNSTENIYLDKIERSIYMEFIQKMFENSNRRISDNACAYAYDLFEGHTYYVHQTLHNVYAYGSKEQTVELSDIKVAVRNIVEDRDHYFNVQMSQLNYTQKETLIAIAKEKNSTEITSVAFIKKHSLQSPSAVQNAVRNLLKTQMITYRIKGKTKIYSISDRFMQIWINDKY